MKSIIIMAWRNLWRNKRRTLITVASIFFAVFFAIVMRSFQLGAYGHMYKSIIEAYTGYIQIQDIAYWDDRTIDNSFLPDAELLKQIQEIENVETLIPHVETFALAAKGVQTKVAMVVGIDPEMEAKMSHLDQKVVQFRLDKAVLDMLAEKISSESVIERLRSFEGKSYASLTALDLDLGMSADDFEMIRPFVEEYAGYKADYLKTDDDGVLIADRLSKFLKVHSGDTIVLFGQGYHGVTAVGKYPVRGIVRIPNPEIDNIAIYMTREQCALFVGDNAILSSLIVEPLDKDYAAVEETTARLNALLSEQGLIARDWRELNALMVSQLEMDNAGGLVMLFVLYLVIAFGVFGTVLMMITERKREFSVLVAIGMQKSKLAIVVAIEMFFLGIIGIVLGALATVPIVYLGYHYPIRIEGEMAKTFEGYGFEPIMPMQWYGDYYWNQALVVVLIVSIAIVYPILKIKKIKETDHV